MSEYTQKFQTQFMEGIKENSGTAILMGILLLLTGVFSIASPFIAGLSVAVMVGIFLVIGGIAQLIFSFKTSMGFFAILFAVLTIVMGGYMLSNPKLALASLTLLLAVYLVASGILEALASFKARPAKGWGWALFSGLISVLLGVMIWGQFPLSGVWAVGTLVGIRLLFNGISLLMLGVYARRAV